MKDTRRFLSNDLIALRYMDALNAGDLETVSSLWEEASHDPELERLLAELDSAMFHEIPGQPSALHRQALRLSHRWAAWAGAVVMAAACVLAILAWPVRDTHDQHMNPRARQAGTAVAHQPADTAAVVSPTLAARRELDAAAVTRFVWPLENTLSASSRLDLLD